MIECQARVLDPISISYKNNQILRTRDGQWRMANQHFFKLTMQLTNWMIIWTCKDQRKNDDYNKFIRQKLLLSMKNTFKNNGLEIMRPPNEQVLENFTIEAIFKMIKEKCAAKPQLIIFIINDMDDKYDRIKSLAELEYGLVTQCLKLEKLMSQMDLNLPLDRITEDRKMDSYLSNVANKINAKIGGINNTIDFKNMTGLILKKKFYFRKFKIFKVKTDKN